jgi:hypothetical protein
MKNHEIPELIETRNGPAKVRLGGAEVEIRTSQNGQYSRYGLHWRVGSKKFRRRISDRNEAISEAKRIVYDLARAEGTRTSVHSGDIVFLNECLRKVGGRSHMLSAIELYLRTHAIGVPRKTVADICDELEAELTLREQSEDVSHEYLKNAKYENGILKKWFGSMLLPQITSELVKTRLLESDYSRTTKRNIIRALKARESFARRKRYVPREFESPFEDIPLPKAKTEKPAVFTPEELTKLFIILHPRQLLYVATMAFGGSRRAEFQKMNAGHFVDEESIACIDADIAKTSARRTLDIPDNLKAWMEIAEKPEQGPLVSKKAVVKVSSEKGRLAQVGLVWKQNVLRHSFISYHWAKYRTPHLTAELAGNSVEIIKATYKSLVTPSAAEAWFNITPISVRAYAKEKGLSHLIKW